MNLMLSDTSAVSNPPAVYKHNLREHRIGIWVLEEKSVDEKSDPLLHANIQIPLKEYGTQEDSTVGDENSDDESYLSGDSDLSDSSTQAGLSDLESDYDVDE